MKADILLFRASEFLRYLWKAKTRYGLHSPFVYALTDKCLYDQRRYPEYSRFKAYRRHLASDRTVLSLQGFGAGSVRGTKNRRSVREMYRAASARWKEMKLYFRLARYFHARRILELGTHLGVSTMAWASGTGGKVISVEGEPALAGYTRKQLSNFGMENVDIIRAPFETFLEDARETFDIIFLDGNHTYEATAAYMRRIKPLMHDDTLLILHDIHWSPSMVRAWNEIIDDEVFHVTLDLFCCGLVWKRPGQYKEHFIIRF